MQDKQFILEPENPRKPPLLNTTKSFSSPGQILGKCNECMQLRKGDMPIKLNTADPWKPGKQIIPWTWSLPLGRSILINLNIAAIWGHPLTHFWGPKTGDRSVYLAIPNLTAHRPSQILTTKEMASAFGQTWTRAGQNLLWCLDNCQFAFLVYLLSLTRILQILCENKHE